MKFTSVHATLKNNKIVTIRQCVPEDAEQLTDVIKIYVEESGFYPESEYNNTINEHAKRINSFSDDTNSLFLVAIHNNTIIGNIDLKASERQKLKHTAIIGVGLLKEWRAIGLGKILFKHLIDWAKQNSTLEILWLQAFSTNTSAINLYKSIGFIEEGRQVKFVKTPEGVYIDLVLMSLPIR